MLEWLIFVSATLGTAFGGRRAVQGWLYDRADRRAARRADLAGWSSTGVNTWTVRLAPPGSGDPQRPGTLTLAVCDHDGEPSPDQAARLRRYLEEHEHPSRNPSPAELAALDAASRNGGELVSAPRRARRPRLFRA